MAVAYDIVLSSPFPITISLPTGCGNYADS